LNSNPITYDTTQVQLLRNLKVLSKIAQHASAAMLHCHKQNVIHADIAARNFLVSKELSAFITDFGMSREIAPDQPFVKGSERDLLPMKWTAPEILQRREYSFKSDVYAFGMFLFEIVALHQPWPDVQDTHILGNYITDINSQRHRPSIPGYCPVQLAELMTTCWSDNIRNRPTAERLSQCLEEFHQLCSDATMDTILHTYQPLRPELIPSKTKRASLKTIVDLNSRQQSSDIQQGGQARILDPHNRLAQYQNYAMVNVH